MKRTIFITGVSAGIGQGLARHYLDQGDRVVGCSRREPVDLADSPAFRFRPIDLRDFDSLSDNVAALLNGTEQVDLAIMNAGVLGTIRDLAESDLDSMRAVLDVNLWAVKVVLDALFASVATVGQVVTISSGAAVNGNRGWGAYSISKAALNMLTKLYAREQPETHFCAFAPGIVDTAMQEVICDREPEERFPSVEVLRSKRGTADMPDANTAAPILAAAIDRLPTVVESGEFTDVRKMS